MKRSGITVGFSIVAVAVLVASVILVSRRQQAASQRNASVEGAPADGAVPALPQGPLKPIVQERMEDPVYVAALKGLIEERSVKVMEAAEVRNAMQALAEAAAEELTAEGVDATEAAVRERVMQHSEWPILEAKAETLRVALNRIADRTQAHIQDRMSEQYAMRRQRTAALVAAGDAAATPPRPMPVIRTMTNEMTLATAPIVVTNRPGAATRPVRVLPDRKPVTLSGKSPAPIE